VKAIRDTKVKRSAQPVAAPAAAAASEPVEAHVAAETPAAESAAAV
jgi:hypothetical protein